MPVLTSKWEEKVRANYKPRATKLVAHYTKYNRHLQVNEYLLSYMKTIRHDVNVLLVGIGRDEGPASPVHHIELAEILRDKDYSMTILDNDTLALHDAAKIDGMLDETVMEYIESKSFMRKKKSGEVRFVLDDIVTADLKPYGPFDIVHCINVLYHIGDMHNTQKWRDEVILAILNMARSLKPGGVMITDGATTLQKSGGIFRQKLNKSVLNKMQLTYARKPVYNPAECITYFFLQKTL
ncbi:MAG: class I SAM-dependent methyltransferase [archaeon]